MIAIFLIFRACLFPASCRNGPPSAQNSQAVVLNPEHGGRVLYLCDEDFKKIENESVVCDFGIWKGKPPVCKDSKLILIKFYFNYLECRFIFSIYLSENSCYKLVSDTVLEI